MIFKYMRIIKSIKLNQVNRVKFGYHITKDQK